MNSQTRDLKKYGGEYDRIHAVKDDDVKGRIAGAEEKLLDIVEDEPSIDELDLMDCEDTSEVSYDFDVGSDFDCGGF